MNQIKSSCVISLIVVAFVFKASSMDDDAIPNLLLLFDDEDEIPTSNKNRAAKRRIRKSDESYDGG